MNNGSSYSISVLTLTARRKDALRLFLGSVVSAGGFDSVEVIILLTGRDEGSEALLKQYQAAYPNIRYYAHISRSRSEARNILIAKARGEILYFLDDDVLVGKNVFFDLKKKFARYPHVSIIGGPNMTPPESSVFQEIQGRVLGSLFGTLLVRRRYRPVGGDRLAGEWAFILCNLAIRRNVFLTTPIRFNPSLASAEENLLLQKLIRSGYQALYSPDIVIFHERRKTLAAFGRQVISYGKGRVQIIATEAPLACFGYMIAFISGVFLAARVFTPTLGYMAVAYVIADLYFSAALARRAGRGGAFFGAAFLFPFLHVSYVLGLLAGAISFFRISFHRKAAPLRAKGPCARA